MLAAAIGGRRRAARRGAGGARHALLGRARRRAGGRLQPRLDARSRPTAARTRTCTASRRCSRPAIRCGSSGRVRITQRLVVDNHPRLNEHFDADWRPLPRLQPRRARASVPALRRDDRALVRVGAAGLHARRRRASRPTRGGCSRGASHDGWDGGGFVYTVDWDGTAGRAPTGCTGCCARRSRAAAVLGRGRAAGRVVGARRARTSSTATDGSWRHELDPSNRPSSTRLGRQAGRLPRAAGDAHPACSAAGLRSPQVCGRRARSIGGGVIAAAVITSANAASRTSSASGSSGSGSWKTIGPAAIVRTLAVALVRAITGTTGPSCSERAETSRPIEAERRRSRARTGG